MFLIDNNVMMGASAFVDDSQLFGHAEPPDPALRETIFNWLKDFDLADARMILDDDGLIRAEYENNMRYNQRSFDQEYGMRVLQSKIDRYQVEFVPIETEVDGGGLIGKFPDRLGGIVLDRADRKWISAAEATYILHDAMPTIVYAAETDWYVIEAQLQEHGFRLQRLLPEAWYKARCE
ncbi:hypothetical protein [Luteimonas sp. MC1828]|uniref:hypothetical protein n=1 Tax=Luteimonas sp. MC1828 TaxID=2799787 RepID=UPI0018F14CF1|nr:hypothetical protein [Luteimonas sp. MC1828]MBJ7574547.1 hypothetical protein [Luteimonas sp. MC1828]